MDNRLAIPEDLLKGEFSCNSVYIVDKSIQYTDYQPIYYAQQNDKSVKVVCTADMAAWLCNVCITPDVVVLCGDGNYNLSDIPAGKLMIADYRSNNKAMDDWFNFGGDICIVDKNKYIGNLYGMEDLAYSLVINLLEAYRIERGL